jgi:hypothetical protein
VAVPVPRREVPLGVSPWLSPWSIGEALTADQATARRLYAIRHLQGLLGLELDPTCAQVAAILNPYCRRVRTDPVPVTVVNDVPGYWDLDRTLGIGYQEPPKRGPGRPRTADKVFLTAVVAAFAAKDWLLDDSDPEKVAVVCPFHPETAQDGDTSTVVFADGKVHCLHARCLGRTQGEFLKALDLKSGNYPPEVILTLEETTPVSVAEAQKAMGKALMAAKPHSATATVVRVTTGAGKTRAVTTFLDDYCCPKFDAETGDIIPGRTAVLALPTNALLREVKERLRVDHRTATGVLAVIQPDGTPGCRKFEWAKRLQAAGGDVHRLMCGKCEFKEGCYARENAVTGEGSLTVTNHALLPSVVRALKEDGKVPLVVWDESPQFVGSARLRFEDLDWLLGRFDYEENPLRLQSLAAMAEVTLFSPQYRVCMRPLVEVLRLFRVLKDLPESVSRYAATRIAHNHLSRGEGLLNLEPVGSAWDRIRRLAVSAKRVNTTDSAFDRLSEANQALVLRSEGVAEALEALYSADTLRLDMQPGAVDVTFLTEHGELWKTAGGVILDATAPVHELQALRPNAVVVDVPVADSDEGIVKAFVHCPGLSRTVLEQRGELKRRLAFEDLARDLSRRSRLLEKRLGRPPKTVVMTYKPRIEEVEKAIRNSGLATLEVAYYGNTRGYDRWFQQGFDQFVTIGDPYPNLYSAARSFELLKLPEDEQSSYYAYAARSEAAQAHGRARDPQRRVSGEGIRSHIHYGRLPPLGWRKADTVVEDLTIGAPKSLLDPATFAAARP